MSTSKYPWRAMPWAFVTSLIVGISLELEAHAFLGVAVWTGFFTFFTVWTER